MEQQSLTSSLWWSIRSKMLATADVHNNPIKIVEGVIPSPFHRWRKEISLIKYHPKDYMNSIMSENWDLIPGLLTQDPSIFTPFYYFFHLLGIQKCYTCRLLALGISSHFSSKSFEIITRLRHCLSCLKLQF